MGKMRRPQRPHDLPLFDPSLRMTNKPRMVSFKETEMPDNRTGRSQRSSGLWRDEAVAGEKLMKRALKHEGLGRYCDEQFIKAEMAEAINMTPSEFDVVASQLLQAEERGEVQLPMANRSSY